MTNQTSIKYISSLLNSPDSVTDGDQSSISLFRQTFPYFVPMRYLVALESHKKTPFSPQMLAGIQPYMGDWIVFCDFLNDGSRPLDSQLSTVNKVVDKKKADMKPAEEQETIPSAEEKREPIIIALPVPHVSEPPRPEPVIAVPIAVVHEEPAQMPVVAAQPAVAQEEPVVAPAAETPAPVVHKEPLAASVPLPLVPVDEDPIKKADTPLIRVPEEGLIKEEVHEPAPEPVAEPAYIIPSPVVIVEEVEAEPAIAIVNEPQPVQDHTAAPAEMPGPVQSAAPAHPFGIAPMPVSIGEDEQALPAEELVAVPAEEAVAARYQPDIVHEDPNTPADRTPVAEDLAEADIQFPEDPRSLIFNEATPEHTEAEFVHPEPVLPPESVAEPEETEEAVEIVNESIPETTVTEDNGKDHDQLIFPIYTKDYFLQQGERVSDEIPLEINELRETSYMSEEDKSLMVVMSFSEWLLHFKNSSERQKEESKDQKALKTMWQKEKLAAAMEEENEEIPETVFAMAVSSITKEEGLVSETLAEIYIKQGKYDKAIEMYRKLSLKNPQKNTYFAAKIEDALKDKGS